MRDSLNKEFEWMESHNNDIQEVCFELLFTKMNERLLKGLKTLCDDSNTILLAILKSFLVCSNNYEIQPVTVRWPRGLRRSYLT